MRYEGKLYRPPSEANAYILQATLGCSWNHCTYCDMYREKRFRVRDLRESLEDLDTASAVAGDRITKLFVADGDALAMPMDHWEPLLEAAERGLPRLKRVSCYASAANILEKGEGAMRRLGELGLRRLYIGPESGDDATLKAIAKGNTHVEHVEAARIAHAAGMELSVIFLLGAGGVERSAEHAARSAELLTAMNPAYAALTLTVVPGTPQAKLQATGRFVLPDQAGLFRELRTLVAASSPTSCVFRTNHASNYLPIAGTLPQDTARIVATIDAALEGRVRLRPEWSRGL